MHSEKDLSLLALLLCDFLESRLEIPKVSQDLGRGVLGDSDRIASRAQRLSSCSEGKINVV